MTSIIPLDGRPHVSRIPPVDGRLSRTLEGDTLVCRDDEFNGRTLQRIQREHARDRTLQGVRDSISLQITIEDDRRGRGRGPQSSSDENSRPDI